THTVQNVIRERCGEIKEIKLVEKDVILSLLHFAIEEKRGVGNFSLQITDDTLKIIANTTGDARTALNVLEDAVFASEKNENGDIDIYEETVKECVENKGLLHDKKGNMYYNL